MTYILPASAEPLIPRRFQWAIAVGIGIALAMIMHHHDRVLISEIVATPKAEPAIVESVPYLASDDAKPLVTASNPFGGTPGTQEYTGNRVAAYALAWVLPEQYLIADQKEYYHRTVKPNNRMFRRGVSAMCAYFVHEVLEAATGKSLPPRSGAGWDGDGGTYKGRAATFFFTNVSRPVPANQMRPGDIVAWNDTYISCGCITHVGIVVKVNGQLHVVDRPTRSSPVKLRTMAEANAQLGRITYIARPRMY